MSDFCIDIDYSGPILYFTRKEVIELFTRLNLDDWDLIPYYSMKRKVRWLLACEPEVFSLLLLSLEGMVTVIDVKDLVMDMQEKIIKLHERVDELRETLDKERHIAAKLSKEIADIRRHRIYGSEGFR